jgi:hypothetical protein
VADLIDGVFPRRHPPGYEDATIRDSHGIHQSSIGKWRRWPTAEVDRLWAIAADVAGLLGYTSPSMESEIYGVA